MQRWKPHTVYLPKCCKAHTDGGSDVCSHGDVSVQVHAKVENGSSWRHWRVTWRVTDTHWMRWSLLLTAFRCIPKNLDLRRIKLQPIAWHSPRHIVSTYWQMLLKWFGIGRVTKSIKFECRQQTRVDGVDYFARAATSQQCVVRTELVRGPNPAGYLSSCRVSLSVAGTSLYHLVNKGLRVWMTCLGSLHNIRMARDWTCKLLIVGPLPYLLIAPLCHTVVT